jgi:predicted ATPase
LERILREELEESPSPATARLVEDLPEIEASEVVEEPPPLAASAGPVGHPLPAGTVTFLLTDLEGIRDLERDAGGAFHKALAECSTLLREQFRRNGGSEVREVRGCFTVAFARPSDALQCAVACQQALAARSWPQDVAAVRMRMALDMREADLKDGHYQSPVLDRARGLLLAAHGGQILCSEAAVGLLRPVLEEGVRLADLGFYRLRSGGGPERLFSVKYPGIVPADFPPPSAALAYTSNLPAQFTRFFGREEELARLQQMLLTGETRLVTLTGPPGSGKTRLALQCARQLLEALHGAVWFVPLQAVWEARLIAGAVLAALGLPGLPDIEPLEQITEVLSRQPSLVVLDNFEQLTEEGAAVLRDLLERVPSLTCLVTSRRGLDLTGESQLLLAPLPTPAGEAVPEELVRCASVQLFVDRAQAVRPDFQVTQASAPIVSELCDRLEGIPLALELAAARAQVLTPSHMLAQLRHRFDFLVTRKRDVEDRHRTLHGAVDWSYQLLSPELQRLLARLSVFRGGWTVEAAEVVCEEPQAVEHLTQLEECSLILTDEVAEEGEEVRLRALETLREYGAELLSSQERAALRQRHAEHYLAFAEDAHPELRGKDQGRWLRRLERDHDNFRAALEWFKSAEDGAEAGLRLACALARFWDVRGYLSEGRRHLEDMLARDGGTADASAPTRALAAAGWMALGQGDFGAAQALLEESLGIARRLGAEREASESLLAMGHVAGGQGDYARAQKLCSEALAMSRALGDKPGIAASLDGLGRWTFAEGRVSTGREHFEGALAIWRELGDRGRLARCLGDIGFCWQIEEKFEREYVKSRKLLEEALAIHRELGQRLSVSRCLANLGWMALSEEDDERSRVLWEEALTIARELGSRDRIAACLYCLAHAVMQTDGDDAAARSLLEEGLSIARELGAKQEVADCLSALGSVVLDQGETATARSLLEECLQVSRDSGVRCSAGWLRSLAEVYLAEDRGHGRAARLLGHADADPEPLNHGGHREGLVAAVRARMEEEAFAAAYAEGRAMSWEEAVAYALEETTDQSADGDGPARSSTED